MASDVRDEEVDLQPRAFWSQPVETSEQDQGSPKCGQK